MEHKFVRESQAGIADVYYVSFGSSFSFGFV